MVRGTGAASRGISTNAVLNPAKGVEHPHGVGPQKPDAVLPGQGRELRLQLLAPVVGVGEPLADHHHPLDAEGRTLLKGRQHPFPAQGDDRQVRDLRQIGQPRISPVAQDLRDLGMHQVNPPLIPVTEQHLQIVVGPGPRLARYADEHHRGRLEEFLHCLTPSERPEQSPHPAHHLYTCAFLCALAVLA